MNWWDIARSFVDGIVEVGKAVLNAVGQTASVVVQQAKKLVDEIYNEGSKSFRPEPKTEKERIERQLQEVNSRIQSLRKKHKERGSLTPSDKSLWQDLKHQRETLNEQLRAMDRVETAEEIVEKEADFESIVISDETAHILQYHVGQSTFNKTCECGRPMVLQWRRELATAGINDFYWGCSGYYHDKICTRITRLSKNDLNLFANLNRPEFEISSPELTQIALDKRRSQKLRAALDSIRDQHRKQRMGVAIYRCPLHGESLVLRKKNGNSAGLLDEYFLGCPRWLPGNEGCNFLVKLKSAAQIGSVLEAETGNGLIQVAN